MADSNDTGELKKYDRVVYVPRDQPGHIVRISERSTYRRVSKYVIYVVDLEKTVRHPGGKITVGAPQLMPFDEWAARFSDTI